ncbi:MAG: DNA-processing protein DprA [Chitinophagaceae bacterium]
MNNDLLYQIGLTLVPTIGPVQAKILLQHCDVEEIFHAKKNYLEKIEGIGTGRAAAITNFNNFSAVEKEIKFIEDNHIQPLFITDENYPKRLLNCYDSPTLLYYKGRADLNAPKIVSIIGTRSHTDYAKNVTAQIVKTLTAQNITVVSGLAFGIDAMAHKAALKNNLPTIGVLGHGLHTIYPAEHSKLSNTMLTQNGGLLTEFRSGTKPDKHNFPSRNRIVAGMSDATIVVETDIKGGSMITAELANGYNKDVFAVPGKITDTKSSGCNYLIKTNKAMLLAKPEDLINIMQWADETQSKKTKKQQRELFIELSHDEKIIVNILQKAEATSIDEINLKSGLSYSTVAAAILNLELQNVILSLPGKLYKMA